MNNKEYISSITFDYFTTYSFLRGEINDTFQANLTKEIEELELAMQHPKIGWFQKNKRLTELRKYESRIQYLLDKEGNFHPTNERIATITQQLKEYSELLYIFQRPYFTDFETVCAPIYRDAIIFFDSTERIVDTLNICFSCKKMESDSKGYISATLATFQKLHNYLVDLGHDINPTTE